MVFGLSISFRCLKRTCNVPCVIILSLPLWLMVLKSATLLPHTCTAKSFALNSSDRSIDQNVPRRQLFHPTQCLTGYSLC